MSEAGKHHFHRNKTALPASHHIIILIDNICFQKLVNIIFIEIRRLFQHVIITKVKLK